MKKFFVFPIILLIVLFTSCKTSDETPQIEPEPYGVWQNLFTISGYDGKETLYLNENGTFEHLFQTKMGANWVYLEGNHSSKGTFVTNNNTFTFTITHTEYYNEVWVNELNPAEIYSGTFTLNGNSMTVHIDLNNDGDYDDEREAMNYTRIS
jgi:hypothetical protein